ncbi:hypothetical protein ACFW4O_33250 [Streptomyces mutabilis]|uniref:hypothetical protein n=1 Tax=Streptomyces TaxID=1883 RepID=UPI00117CECFB|nr:MULTISPECIES: hypothetical protein [unclassified Streptomyces]MDN3250950.1 hypothetical protein [Streptomyces sp. ZSW22]MDN3257810.1 hypothetical protein [Streptomyces sp. MA25(2023)]
MIARRWVDSALASDSGNIAEGEVTADLQSANALSVTRDAAKPKTQVPVWRERFAWSVLSVDYQRVLKTLADQVRLGVPCSARHLCPAEHHVQRTWRRCYGTRFTGGTVEFRGEVRRINSREAKGVPPADLLPLPRSGSPTKSQPCCYQSGPGCGFSCHDEEVGIVARQAAGSEFFTQAGGGNVGQVVQAGGGHAGEDGRGEARALSAARPPDGGCPLPPATAASIFSVLMNSATWNSTAAAPNSSSRS